MGFTGGTATGRARWLGAFTLLFAFCAAVPVLADSSTPGDMLRPDGQPAEGIPSGVQVSEGLQKAALEDAKDEGERETAAAAEEREESLEAFVDASPAEAMNLMEAQFAEQLGLVDQDPARMLSDVSVEQILGPTTARVKADGDTMLLEGTMPVRVPEEDGDLSKVNLDLVQTGDGLTQANPLTEVELPDSAAEGVTIGNDGLAIEPVLTEGASAAHRLGDKDVFYPETQTDTDLLAMPMASGVELFSQLRSVESPEELRFELALPEGSALSADGEGGAEITREGTVLARVPAPNAVDAQGAEVPVEMSAEGTSLVLDVAHRGMEVAYPLLVDPAIAEDWATYGSTSWYGGNSIASLENGTWSFASNNFGRFLWGTKPLYTAWGGANRGLYISAKSTAETQWAYQNGQWSYTAPGASTYITAAGINPFWRDNHGCTNLTTYPEPHDYMGLWSPAYNGWTYFQKDAAQAYSYAFAKAPEGWSEIISPVFVMGLGTGIYNTTPNPCWRDIYAGGIYVWMSDQESPTLSSVTGAPSGWVSDKTEFTIKATASDAGLGVQYATLFPEGTGYIESPAKQSQCTGLRASMCSASAEFPFKLTGSSFDEGKKWAQLAVADPLGKVSATSKWEMRVDRTPPEVTLSGQLAKETSEAGSEEVPAGKGDELSLPVYNLTVKATDGSKKEGKTMRSGVKNMEILLDGKKETVPWEPLASCPESSCEMNKTWPLKLTGLAAGKHTLKVIAVDFVGKERIREIEFEYFPATGMKDEYVLYHFPLPDGQGNETEEEFPDRPELAVNVMNGNLVYRQKDVEIDGASADLEVERYYNSQLPTAENTEWGDGWTLAETPDLEPKDTGGSPAPDVAELLDSSGAIEDGVQLPAEVGKTSFDPTLQATLTKEPGGYALSDETGSAAGEIVFDESGRTEELRTGEYSTVDYGYEGGALEEISVKDPATATSEGLPAVKAPAYASAFGALGSGNGQLKGPKDVAVDASGNLFVADKANNRIEKFNAKGEYLTKFGTLGSGNGQLNRPTALAIDAKGNVWVADSDNNRIQEFSPSGTYLAKFGSAGTGNGQFAAPEGIAIGPEGNIWVSDTDNGRLQKFSAAGAFIKAVSSKGSGAGQLGEPKAIDTTASGAVWVTDWQYNRVAEFGPGGEFMRQFGSAGTGNGQFEHPTAIGIGSEGSLWIADNDNYRIQRFGEGGSYLTKFGAAGSGSGQFGFAGPAGIAVEASGNVWIADPTNNRIQKWIQSPAAEEDDPSVELNVEGGLVRGLEGEEAGTRSYAYSGDDLTSQTGPLGKTAYKYDAVGRMTEVTLPNKTYAVIAYDTLGRVKSVAVAPGGTGAKTTYFEYKDEPRGTTVVPPGKPAIYYDIGEDGSVVKYSNTEKPPIIDDVGGTLWEERGEVHPEPVNAGDKNLTIQAHSDEGVEFIKVIANGTTLVDELQCKQDQATKDLECVTPSPKDEWITNTNNHAPGILNLEVIATDRNNLSSARKFWVNIPVPPPPPPPGAINPPTFEEVLHFREEFGLDVWEPVEDELDLNDRVWNVLGAWHNPETPEGQVARASMERWGTPLRPQDAIELDVRLAYQEQAASVIPAWAAANAPTTYADYYVDERKGGLIYVGFTSEQATKLTALKEAPGLMAPGRIVAFPASPSYSLSQLNYWEEKALSLAESNPALTITTVSVDSKGNQVTVGATDVTAAENAIKATFGSNTPISVSYEDVSIQPRQRSERERLYGDIHSGDRFAGDGHSLGYFCTAGFGAWSKVKAKATDEPVTSYYMLTAGHCAYLGEPMRRRDNPTKNNTVIFGETERRGYDGNAGTFDTDASAIRLKDRSLTPRYIYTGFGPPFGVKGVVRPRVGMMVCQSGYTSDSMLCGRITRAATNVSYEGQTTLQVAYNVINEGGDSGGPVWQAGTANAVGIVTAGSENRVTGKYILPSYFTPLLANPTRPHQPGIFGDPDLAPLHLFTVDSTY